MKDIPDISVEAIITPLGSKVLTQPFMNQAVINGVYIPEEHRQFCGMSKVLAVGPGTKKHPTHEVKVGDVIAIDPLKGQEIRIDGQPCRLVEVADILGVYRE